MWNPGQYLRFAAPRMRPAMDLLAQINIENPDKIVDLGCGPGTITTILKQRWPNAEIVGVDADQNMLKKAHEVDRSIKWEKHDVKTWNPQPKSLSIIYSNAALHWTDKHEELFPRLTTFIKPNGILAIQMPQMFSAPTHTYIDEVLRELGWKDPRSQRISPPKSLQEYYDILKPFCSELDLWESTYCHLLEGANPVVEWVKGSALIPVLDGLKTDSEKSQFLERYSEKIAKAYPTRADGITILPFRRIFLIGRVSG